MEQYDKLLELAYTEEAGVLLNEPMSRHTTFKIGGPCDVFIVPKSLESLGRIYSFCRSSELPYFILGNGSNLLVADEGIRCAVIKLGQRTGSITAQGDMLVCEAGAQLSSACLAAQSAGLSGLEFAYGIPGTVGGAVFMNAGAYGGEIKDVFFSADSFTQTGPQTIPESDAAFSYRRSIFSENNAVIASVCFRLHKGDSREIENKMQELMLRRRDKQPLEFPSAGSVFKRPEGYYAGTLIEHCGLKGRRCGGAAVSDKHAGFIVNLGGATAADVLALIDTIRNEVLQKTGVTLEPEIKTIGGR